MKERYSQECLHFPLKASKVRENVPCPGSSLSQLRRQFSHNARNEGSFSSCCDDPGRWHNFDTPLTSCKISRIYVRLAAARVCVAELYIRGCSRVFVSVPLVSPWDFTKQTSPTEPVGGAFKHWPRELAVLWLYNEPKRAKRVCLNNGFRLGNVTRFISY